jgi:nucleoid-associated protein YgaU
VQPAPAPAQRTYTVKEGDTLTDISRRELGTAARANEIAELNGLSDPGRIKLGQVLKLPPK